jgi:hypothetical protein
MLVLVISVQTCMFCVDQCITVAPCAGRATVPSRAPGGPAGELAVELGGRAGMDEEG